MKIMNLCVSLTDCPSPVGCSTNAIRTALSVFVPVSVIVSWILCIAEKKERGQFVLFSFKKLFTNHHVVFGLFVMKQFENVYVHISYYSIEEVM